MHELLIRRRGTPGAATNRPQPKLIALLLAVPTAAMSASPRIVGYYSSWASTRGTITTDGRAFEARLDIRQRKQARLPGDFGTPTVSTLYRLCLYDTGARIGETRIAPGPGWRATASGFHYSALDRSAKVLLKAGLTGRPKVHVNLKGGPTLWSATYTNAKTNVLGSFSARTP